MNTQETIIALGKRCAEDTSFRTLAESDMEQALKEIGVTDIAQFRKDAKQLLSDESLNDVAGGIGPYWRWTVENYHGDKASPEPPLDMLKHWVG